MANDARHTPGPSGPDFVRARDAGLALVGRVNRWMIAAAVLLAAGISAVTAHAFHARSAAVTQSAASAARPTVSARQATDDTSGGSLPGPSQAPAPALAAAAAPGP